MLHLPIELENAASLPAGLRLVQLWRRVGSGSLEPQTVPWDSMPKAQRRKLYLDLGRMHAGLIAWELSAHCRLELGPCSEDFVFSVDGSVLVAPHAQSVNIEIKDCTFGVGATGVLASSISGAHEAHGRLPGFQRAGSFERADRVEMELGVRGYKDLGCRVYRDVILRHEGPWRETDRSLVERPFVDAPEVWMGRDRPDAKVRQFTALRIYDAQGVLDVDASKRISRRQIALRLRNDRLTLESVGQAEVHHNQTRLARHAEVVLSDGDRVKVESHERGPCAEFSVGFLRASGVVKEIQLRRAW